MEIYIHKQTGKGWLLIDEINADTGDFISPSSRRMQRPFSEFQDESESDVADLLRRGVITSAQIDALTTFEESRKEEFLEDVIQHFRDLIRQHGRAYAEQLAKERFSEEIARYVLDRASP